MIKTVGVYTVDTTADIPEPSLLRDSRNNPSAIKIPRNPLNASVKISCWEKLGVGMEKTTIVKINPKTPTRFLRTFNWMAENFLVEISSRITADDQQTAVITAYRSPMIQAS